ncbi:glucosaminidase domain-containing protein [Compostibacter hankyongensis]|uniref:Peptidoglycan hydrolase n=1 Tax=Compostibacter hankyongensis TaxID=1007089 RepID=A0ABP8FYB0_9BACT
MINRLIMRRYNLRLDQPGRGVRILFCLTGLGFCFGAKAQSRVDAESYIAAYKTLAETEMLRTGVPAAISLAQGILESDAGNSWLVQHSNNHFGIKCKNNWQGATVLYDDDSRNECFRKYASATDSWHDHSDFIRSSPRYASLFDLDPLDYKAWATGLKKAGYATSKTYVERLLTVIDRYGLQRYSIEALANKKQTGRTAFATMLDKKVNADERERGTPAPAVQQPPAPVAVVRYPAGIFRINGKKVMYMKRGSALLPVADQFKVKLRRLVKYNELQGDAPLKKDMLVYLQQKGKTGSHAVHKVLPGEDVRTIAQREGIRLKNLYKLNRMRQGDEPAVGAVLYLQHRAEHAPALLGETVAPALAGRPGGQAADPGTPVSVSRSKAPEEREDIPAAAAVPDVAGEEEAASPARKEKKRDRPADIVLPMDEAPAASPAETDPAAQAAPQTAQPSSPAAASRPDNRKAAVKKAAPPAKHAVAKRGASGKVYHTVRSGDTLYDLGKRYGVSVAKLKQWNKLKDSKIRIGQKLIVKE